MKPEIHHPKDKDEWLRLRSHDITSTESPALLGLSPYATEFELWHRHKESQITLIEENDRMKWGTRLQSAIASGIAEDQGWQIREMKEYIRISELRMGSSFDYCIKTGPHDMALLEIKNVDGLQFKEGWIIDDEHIEAPPHIEIQVQHQLAVSGLGFAYIGALIGGNQVVLTKRDRDDAIIKKIQEKIAIFWESINNNIPPRPNFERDAEFIAKLYGFAEPGKLLTATEQIEAAAIRYKAASNAETAAKKAKDAAKAELLTLIGTAEKVSGEEFTISAGLIGPVPMNYVRSGYRNFKIHWKKQKEFL